MGGSLVRSLGLGALLLAAGASSRPFGPVASAQGGRPTAAAGGWNAPLREAIAGTTRVRLLPAPGCTPEEAHPPRDVNDPAEVEALLGMLVFEEREDFGVCGCIGGTVIELSQVDGRVEELQLVCGVWIRWRGWPGDGVPLPANQDALIEWLARHGVTGPRDEKRASQARAAAASRQHARAIVGMSEGLREAFEHDSDRISHLAVGASFDRFRARLAAEVPVAADRIVLLLRVLGADFGSWSGLAGDEQVADGLLREYDSSQLEAECAAALLGDDRQARQGATRFWDSWQSPIEDGLEEAALRSAMLSVLQEARSPDLRQRAQSLLRDTWQALPPSERETRLQAGLHDPDAGVRRKAMLVAGQAVASSAEELLLRVLAGEAVEVRPLPAVPPEEEDVGDDWSSDRIAPSATEPEVAALALAYMRSTRGQAVLDQRGDATARFRVARALLGGHCDRLVASDFNTSDPPDQAFQLAAVEAVVRCRGRHGLGHAIAYEQASHGWEPEQVATDLRTMLLAADAPGRSVLEATQTLEQLRSWYERYGAAHERRARAR